MKNLRIVHQLPGRIRFFVPEIYRDKNTAVILRSALLKVKKGIKTVEVNPLTGRILIIYDQKKISLDKITYILNCLRGLGLARVRTLSNVKRQEQLVEPEDLPIQRQLFNVALGGSVLGLLVLKQYTMGKSPLAGSKQLFYLAAATMLISGYPVLRSGFTQLTRGRLNHDLVMSALSIVIVLLRESIPGLTVIWLVNLTALISTLLGSMAQKAIKKIEGSPGKKPIQMRKVHNLSAQPTPWDSNAIRYGERVAPLSAGLAGLTGLVTGNYSRSLAMLLAATPQPVRLGVSTVHAAALTGALNQGILIKEPVYLEKMARVNCLVLPQSILKPQVLVGHVYSLSEMSETDMIRVSAALSNNNKLPWCEALWKEAKSREIKVPTAEKFFTGSEGLTGFIGDTEVAVGTEQYLQDNCIDANSAAGKIQRLRHYGEKPLYVIQNRQIVGLIGIREKVLPESISWLRKLKSFGISNIITFDEGTSVDERLNLVRKLKTQYKTVAYLGRKDLDLPAFDNADVTLTYKGSELSVLYRAGAILIRENPVKILEFRRLAFKAEEVFHRNVSLVRGLNLLGLGLGAVGRLSPVGALMFNNLISILTALNSIWWGLSLRKKNSRF